MASIINIEITTTSFPTFHAMQAPYVWKEHLLVPADQNQPDPQDWRVYLCIKQQTIRDKADAGTMTLGKALCGTDLIFIVPQVSHCT